MRDSVAFSPIGPDGAGEGNYAVTPAATTPCIATTKAWMVESDRPRAVKPVANADRACCPPSSCGSHSPVWKPGVQWGGERGRLGG